MSSSELRDLSNCFPNIDEKFPRNCFLSMIPLNSGRTQGLKIDPLIKNEVLEKNLYRKKNFIVTKRSLKIENSMKKQRSDAGKPSVTSQIYISNKVRNSARKFLRDYRRNKNYSAPENLTNYHYKLIRDVTAEARIEEATEQKREIRKIGKIIKSSLSDTLVGKINWRVFDKLIFNKIPKLNPNSALKLFWDIILLILSTYCLFVYTIEKCFKTDMELEQLTFPLVYLFYFDVAVKLNTKHFYDGVQLVGRGRILRHYLKTYFFTEIIPTLSLSAFFIFRKSALYDVHISLFLRVLRAPKLGQKLMEANFKGEKAESLFELIILLLKIFAWGHLIACLWHYTGYLSNFENPNQENWLKKQGISKADWKDRYLFSIYWSVTTMLTVGYGDITPTNRNEMYFTLFAMVLGCGVFGYSMNKIGEILKYGGKEERLIKNKMKKLDILMQGKELPPETQTKVKKYMEFVWKQEQKEDTEHEDFIMSKLSSNLRDEVFFHSNVKYLKNVPGFQTFSNETLIKLATCMKKIRISPEEYLYREGEYEEQSVFFVIDGSVVLTSERETVKGKSSVTWQSIKKDGHFGIREVFTGHARRTNAISIEFGSIFQLNRSDILKVLRKNPQEYEKFCKIKDLDILYNQQSHYKIKCESCDFFDHITQECKFLRYEPNKLNLIAKFNFLKYKYERSKKRNVRAKNNALLSRQKNIRQLNEFLAVYEDDEDLCDLTEAYKMPREDKGESQISIEETEPYIKRSSDKFLLHEDIGRLAKGRKMSVHFLKSQKKRTRIHVQPHHEISNKSINDEDEPRNEKSEKKILISPESNYNASVSTSGPHNLEKYRTNMHHEETLNIDKMKSMKIYFPWNNAENTVNQRSLHMRKKSLLPYCARLKNN